jgi:hypothetical protein
LTCGYADRIIVAGGGGGGGPNANGYNSDSGGGLTGSGPTCTTGNESATQECAGQSDSPQCPALDAGGFGPGGNACGDYGAGGGGWYGGGSLGLGGGGSGYISPLAKSGSFPGGTSTGDGKVIITTTT